MFIAIWFFSVIVQADCSVCYHLKFDKFQRWNPCSYAISSLVRRCVLLDLYQSSRFFYQIWNIFEGVISISCISSFSVWTLSHNLRSLTSLWKSFVRLFDHDNNWPMVSPDYDSFSPWASTHWTSSHANCASSLVCICRAFYPSELAYIILAWNCLWAKKSQMKLTASLLHCCVSVVDLVCVLDSIFLNFFGWVVVIG